MEEVGTLSVGVFVRSAPLPTGGHLDQADGTAWMAFYCLCMLDIAVILIDYDPMYEEIAARFLEHFVWITYAMDRMGVTPEMAMTTPKTALAELTRQQVAGQDV